jgi:hypothetical protein
MSTLVVFLPENWRSKKQENDTDLRPPYFSRPNVDIRRIIGLSPRWFPPNINKTRNNIPFRLYKR